MFRLLLCGRLSQLLYCLVSTGGGQTAGCTEDDSNEQVLGVEYTGNAVESNDTANRTQETGNQRDEAVNLSVPPTAVLVMSMMV